MKVEYCSLVNNTYSHAHFLSPGLKARSRGAIFSECDCDFFYRMQWVVWMSMILFRWCDCNVFLCVMLHMNRFHTHSVRLRCVMCNWDVRFQITYICIYAHTNCNHTMWTKTKSHSQNIVPCERALKVVLKVFSLQTVEIVAWLSMLSTLDLFFDNLGCFYTCD